MSVLIAICCGMLQIDIQQARYYHQTKHLQLLQFSDIISIQMFALIVYVAQT